MAIPGNAAVELAVQAKFNVVFPDAEQAPGGLFPMRAAAFQMDEYRIMAGWPVPVPPCDINIATLVSATGEVLADRETPTSLLTGAVARWVADTNFVDQTALKWTALQGDVFWESSVEYMPELITDYEYRVNDERFVGMSALNFDSDTANHMWGDLSRVIGGTTGYTLLMVMSPNSAFGNDVTVPYNGLWCPQVADNQWVSLTMQGNYLYHETEVDPRTIGISISQQLNSTAPSYIAIVVGRPLTTMYVGTGPSNIQIKQLPTASGAVPLNDQIFLGRSTGDVLHTADMALFDLGIYPNPLTSSEVRDEFAVLSRIYGGDT